MAARAFLSAALETPRPADARRVIVLPAPGVRAGGVGPAGEPPSVFFAHAGRTTLTGWGTANAIARSDHDLGAVRSQAEDLERQTETLTHDRLPRPAHTSVPWIGGHSFAADSRADPVWAAFPATCFVVPRWTHRLTAHGPTLTLVLGANQPVDARRLLEEYDALASGGPRVLHRPPSRPPLLPALDADRGCWFAGIRGALAAIESGAVRKVVLARHLDLTLGSGDAIDVVRVLDDLGRHFPTCTRFLLARDGAEFFGATPETLVERCGDRIRAEAMAGSCRPGNEALLATSGKEAREHALVVDHVVTRLRPVCDSLALLPAATVRRFANIAHLWTPIEGRLARSTHVLDLVAHLHPTPAVAGTPTSAAMALLERTETAPRGWYAGPFGWFDASGDGHFAVALRSCVRSGRGVRLYAGAGIVRGSDPEQELEEITLKLRALLDTLHARTDEPAERVG